MKPKTINSQTAQNGSNSDVIYGPDIFWQMSEEGNILSLEGKMLLMDGLAFKLAIKRDEEPDQWIIEAQNLEGDHYSINNLFESTSQAFGAELLLPEDVPEVLLTEIKLSFFTKEKCTKLEATAAGDWEMIPGDRSLVIKQVKVELERKAEEDHKELTGSIGISSDISAKIHPYFSIEQFHFTFKLNNQKEWGLSGNLHANLLEHAFQFTASYEQEKASKSIELKAELDNALELISWANEGGFYLSGLGIGIKKSKAKEEVGEEDQAEEKDKETKTSLQVMGKGRLLVAPWINLAGTLTLLHGQEDGKGFSFKPDHATLEIPIQTEAVPVDPVMALELGTISILKKEKAWEFEGATSLQLKNIPKPVETFLPLESLSGFIKKDAKRLQIGVEATELLNIAFPEINIDQDGKPFSLGQPSLGIDSIAVELGTSNKFIQELSIGVPEQINGIFGWDRQNNRPRHKIFNSTFKMRLAIGQQFGISLLTSPFQSLEFSEKSGDDGQWAKLNMQPFAEFDLRVPEFSYNKKGWFVSAGFERQGDIKIPLSPLKSLFKHSPFAAVLPDALPLIEVDFASDKIYEQLAQLMGAAAEGEANNTLQEVLKQIQKAIKILPPQLQEYLKIEIPASVIFEMGIDPFGGGMTFGLKTFDPNKPIRLILPMMTVLPELMGLTIRELKIGQKAGGALTIIGIDGYIDRFDLLQLGAALTRSLVDPEKKPVDISNRFYFDDTLLIMPTALPVPIPLFTDGIGLDYRGALGLEMQSNWAFPDPEWGIREYIQIIKSLGTFLKDKNALLHQDQDLIDAMNLKLSIGRNYIKLPDYLGGATLGIQEALPTIPIDEGLARFFDFCKTGNLNYLITAIPVQSRIGHKGVALGPIEMEAAWCITSETEFKELVIAKDQLPESFHDGVLQALPEKETGKALDNGFIILMAGGVELGPVAGLEGQLGLALTSTGGLETGFRLYGDIANTLGLELGGLLHATQEQTLIKGSIALVIMDRHRLGCEASILVHRDYFKADIAFIFTDHCQLNGGFMIGKEGLGLNGSIFWESVAGQVNEYGVEAVFSKEGMLLAFPWQTNDFKGEVSIQLPGKQGAMFQAGVALEISQEFQQAFKSTITRQAKKAAEESVDQIYGEWQALLQSVDDLDLSLKDLRNWVPTVCSTIIRQINTTIINNTPGIYSIGRPIAEQKAAPYIARLHRLSNAAKNTGSPDQRTELQSAIQDIINHNHLKIVISISLWGKTIDKKVHDSKMIDKKNLDLLRKAVQWIDKLPEEQALLVDAEVLYKNLPERDKILGEIQRGISAGIENAIPIIKAIRFETNLGIMDPRNTQIEAEVLYNGKTRMYELSADLTNSSGTAGKISSKFGTGGK